MSQSALQLCSEVRTWAGRTPPTMWDHLPQTPSNLPPRTTIYESDPGLKREPLGTFPICRRCCRGPTRHYNVIDQPSELPNSTSFHYRSLHLRRTRDHRACERTRNSDLTEWHDRRILSPFRALAANYSSFRRHTTSLGRREISEELDCLRR